MRFDRGVACMMVPPSSCAPRECRVTAHAYWAKLGTLGEGLYWRVATPAPMRLKACASLALQDRHPYAKLRVSPLLSLPSRCMTSSLPAAPHRTHRFGPRTVFLRAVALGPITD